jgi:glycosyltransferase involved in cell wall biosynthesis
MGANVVNHSSDDFSEIRNFALKESKSDWVFYIDSDERADLELIKTIKLNIQGGDNSCFKIKRKNFYLGNNPWPKIEEIERVFKKSEFIEWYGDIHESPKYKGSSIVIDGFLNHYTHRNLSQMLDKTIAWSDIEAKNRFESGHPKMALWRFPRVMITTFFDYYIKQKGYSVGTVGLIESIYQSFSTMITYAKLWELQNKHS